MFEERVVCVDKDIVELEKKAMQLADEAAKLHGQVLHMELDAINDLNEEWLKRISEACRESKEVDQASFLLSNNIRRVKMKRCFKTRLPNLFKKGS